MAGYQSENNATSWSNLQDCKISSRAEIPKLDRVWQKVWKNYTMVKFFRNFFDNIFVCHYQQSTARTPTAGTPHARTKKKEKTNDYSGHYVIVRSRPSEHRPPEHRPLERHMLVPKEVAVDARRLFLRKKFIHHQVP